MFNIYLGIYIVVAIIIIAGGTFKLNGMGQSIGSIVFFIGALIVLIVYGIRWFGATNSLFSDTPVSWPPTINTCPDYLVQYSRSMPNGTKQNTCIDTIGVSKNGSLKVFPKGGQAPSSDDYYFSLATTSSESGAKNSELCQRAIAFGLTWEGITNGESCISLSNPSGSAPNTRPSSNAGCPA